MATAAEAERAILLRGDDNVAVAARPIPKGFVADGRRPDGRGPRADRAGAQGRPGRHRGRGAGPEVRPDHRLRLAADPRRGVGPRPQRQGRPVRARLRLRHRAARRSADGRAADLPGLPPPRRAGRHAELRRGHQHGELLGEHVAVHRRAVPRRRLAQATSPTSTASSRSRTRGAAAMPFDGPDHQTLERVLAGFANHPNVAAYVIVGPRLRGQLRAAPRRDAGPRRRWAGPGATAPRPSRSGPRMLNIQEQGGITKTVEAAVAAVHQLLPEANAWTRTEQPASKICLAMECGGSDGNSGVTANPALGVAADLVVAQGGTAVLGETTEIYGAEHLLTRRAVTPGGRREARRADQVVGVVRRRLRRRDQQQPVARATRPAA